MNYLFCEVCNKQLGSAQNWEAHVIGKAHLSRVRTFAATPDKLFCGPCNKQCISISNFEQHCKGKAHLQRAGPLNVPAVPVFNFDIFDDEDEWKVIPQPTLPTVAPQPKSAQVITHILFK